jgi:thiosulfate/3-mercaptopyruvate sulfurtransferase
MLLGMNSKINLLYIAIVLFIGCAKNQVPKDYLIDIHEFEELSKKNNVKIIDFRKLAAYNKGHIKNSINIWRSDIEDHSFPYGGMKASKKQLETLFSNLGIDSKDTLIIFDDKGLCDAARLWWVLQYYNFTNVKLLDGGFSTINSAKIPLTTNKPTFVKTAFTFSSEINTAYYASRSQLEKAIENNAVIIDTRTVDEHLGNILKKGAFVKGKIPNSKLVDWANAINYSGNKKTKNNLELEKIYSKIGVNKNDTIYVYCHSGVRSAHTTFVLTQLLGYKHVLNYDGSWTEWSYYQKEKRDKLKNQ